MLSKSMVIAGTHSGTGKTTVAVGIMSALRKRGLSVQPFKVGPDFIDPGYHETVCGIPSRNLDGWMLNKRYNLNTFFKNSIGKHISVIEGVMGLYDGVDGTREDGSTAQISKWLQSPIVLVLDASSMARSVGAIVYGFERYDKQIRLAGVILNRVSSERHYRYLKDAIVKRCKTKVIGYLPNDPSVEIPERHLGLVTATEHGLTNDFKKRLTDLVHQHIDMDLLLKIAKPVDGKRLDARLTETEVAGGATPSVKIGVAYDEAFSFYYPDNFDILKQCGAELIYFSPLRDGSLPGQLDGIYFGGGYPEIYARDLEANRAMRNEVKTFAANGGVIYAECGGLIYLGDTITDVDHHHYKMSGVFPFTVRMERKLKDLGYYSLKVIKNNILSKRGDEIRGHQFRYSSLESIPGSLNRVYHLRKGEDGVVIKEGFALNNVLASYLHLHFGSNINFARRFVESCRRPS